MITDENKKKIEHIIIDLYYGVSIHDERLINSAMLDLIDYTKNNNLDNEEVDLFGHEIFSRISKNPKL